MLQKIAKKPSVCDILKNLYFIGQLDWQVIRLGFVGHVVCNWFMVGIIVDNFGLIGQKLDRIIVQLAGHLKQNSQYTGHEVPTVVDFPFGIN